MVAGLVRVAESVGVGCLVRGRFGSASQNVPVLDHPVFFFYTMELVLSLSSGSFFLGVFLGVLLGVEHLDLAVVRLEEDGVLKVGTHIHWRLVDVVLLGVEHLDLAVVRLEEDGVLKVGAHIHWRLVVVDCVTTRRARVVWAPVFGASHGHSVVFLLLLGDGLVSSFVEVTLLLVLVELKGVSVLGVVVDVVAVRDIIVDRGLVRVDGVLVLGVVGVLVLRGVVVQVIVVVSAFVVVVVVPPFLVEQLVVVLSGLLRRCSSDRGSLNSRLSLLGGSSWGWGWGSLGNRLSLLNGSSLGSRLGLV